MSRQLRTRPHPLALALSCALGSALPAGPLQAQALPSGASVAAGQATIVTQGNRMTVTNSAGAVLNWQSFSIGAGQSVYFQQPGADSRVLNRVLGRDPSQIMGSLGSNGAVWLINPYGVMFGSGARVDVASLVASTLAISDADWQSRRYSLTSGGGSAAVVNQGEIRTAQGGRVLLVGGQGGVRNEGLVEAPGGQVMLAAGASVDLADSSSPQMAVRVTAPAGQALNLGRLIAAGGQVDLQAAMVNQQGIVRADALAGGAAGEVRLTASDTLTLAAGSHTSADGDAGGRIAAQGGTTLVSGRVQADGRSDRGGDIRLLGGNVGLLDGSEVSASGQAGGGQVLVGGGLQGRDSAVPNASATYMDAGASVRADAAGRGDGGRIVLWSDKATRAYGQLSARGGAQGGDGGFIETSGGWLDARPRSVRTDAPLGRPGQWLLDPNDLLITDDVGTVNVTGGPNFRTTNDSAVLDMDTIASALAAGNNVSVSTSSSGTNAQAGTITFAGPLSLPGESGTPVNLVLNAGAHIDLSGASISASGVPLNVTLNAGVAGAGTISISHSSIVTAGSVTLGGPGIACGTAGCAPFAGAVATTEPGRGYGISVTASTIEAGRITMRGASTVTNQDHGGIFIDSSSLLQAPQISLSGWSGSAATTTQHGVLIDGTLAARDRLTIDGTSRISGAGAVEGTAVGVELSSTGVLAVGPAAMDGAPGPGDGPLAAARVGGRQALATDPSRTLQITGRSDTRSGMFDSAIHLGGSMTVSDKAGVVLRGDGGAVDLAGGNMNLLAAGQVLSSGNSRLRLTGDLLPPTGEPLRFTNAMGIEVSASMQGAPSEWTLDAASGPVLLGTGFLPITLDIGSAPFVARGTAFEMQSGPTTPTALQAGTVRVQAPSIELGNGASIAASGAGDAIVLAGRPGNATHFVAGGSVPSLLAPNGRWLVYATDPTDAAHFDPGPLSRDFTQYNATPSSTVLGTGNGMLFSLAPLLQVSGTLSGPTSKTYDGSTATSATLAGAALTGLLPGDTLEDSPSFGGLRYASPNVGSSIPFVLTLTGGVPSVVDGQERPVFGYGFSSTLPGMVGSIGARTVRVDTLPSLDKVYDATTAVNLQGATLQGMVAGETLTLLPGSVAFEDANAGVGKTVAGQLGLASGTGSASNYVLADGGQFSTRASITPRPVTLTGATVADKVYDATTSATVTGGSLTGLVGAQTLTVGTGSLRFADANAGSDKPVTGTLVLGDGTNGGLAANYQLTDGPALKLSGNITPRPLTLAGVGFADKVYDGSTTAVASGGALQGLLPGQSLAFTLDPQFADARAGTGKPVFAAATLQDGDGGLAGNYRVTGGGAGGSATILPRPVTVQGVSAQDKPYDGTTAATLSAQVFQGLVPGESLSLAAQASFDTKAVGTGKPVSGSLALADGPNGQAANYVLTNGGSFSGSASITPRGLVVTSAAAADKVYDGSVTASVSGFTLDGVLAGEQVSAIAGSGRFADADVGSGKLVIATATTLGGADAGNYVLAQPATQARASITPATLTYAADAVSKPVGQPVPLLTGSITGLVGSDTLATATTGTLGFSTTASADSPLGSYPVLGSGLVARNYVFTQAPGNASALSVVPLSTSALGEPTSTLPPPSLLVEGLRPPSVVSSVQAHRTFDALPALLSAPPVVSFRVLDLDGTSEQDLASQLAARDRYKKAIFADAIKELETNPGAADTSPCQTVEQAAAGICLVTDALKPALRARLPLVDVAPATAPSAPSATPLPTAPATAAAPAPAVPAPPPRPLATADAGIRLPAARAVRTAALPQIQRKWALLIGTDVYTDTRIPQLDNAVADVDAVARVLEGKLGYQTVVVRNGTKAAIVRAFNQLAAVVDRNDSVAIYYAGHGDVVEKTGLGYWQPSDAQASRAETWLSNTDIGKLLGQLGAQQVVLVSDSCFSGSLVSDERIRGSSGTPDVSALLSRRAAVVMSSGGNEPVFDSGKNGHSTFAWSFMQALGNVSSWRPGGNVFEQVRFAVARQLPQRPQYGASRLGGHQSGADYVFEQRQLVTPGQ
jgi:filamentous hemagglutinin family protein